MSLSLPQAYMLQDISQATTLLSAGEVVGVPTETVYGLAGLGYRASSISKIYALKHRPLHNPLILHYAAWEDSIGDVEWTPWAEYLARRFWPGPLTLVLSLSPHTRIPLAATGGLSSAALRVPAHPMILEILKQLGQPLAAPSANLSGELSPTTPAHVAGSLPVPILDGGPCTYGLESTIVDGRTWPLKILRPGALCLQGAGGEIREDLYADMCGEPWFRDCMSVGGLDHRYLRMETEQGRLDVQKGSMDVQKGQVRMETEQGSMDVQQGSMDVQKGSMDVQKGSMDVQQGRLDVQKGLLEVQKGQVRMETEQGSMDVQKGQVRMETEQGSMDAQKGRLDVQKGGVEMEGQKTFYGGQGISPETSRDEMVICPGQLTSHYAPKKPLRLNATSVSSREGLVAFGPPLCGAKYCVQLSLDKNLVEAARNLFSALHHLDQSDCEGIAVMPIPKDGMGWAIADRLVRACA